MTQGRDTASYKKLRAIVLAPREGATCWLCHGPILYGLRRGHPKGPSLDHVKPLSKGGSLLDPRNVRLAHFGCNAARGNRPVNNKPISNPSRIW